MTQQTLDKAKRLSDEITGWKTTCNRVFNQGLAMVNNPTGAEYMLSINRILTVEQHNTIRNLLSDIVAEKINKLEKEFAEL